MLLLIVIEACHGRYWFPARNNGASAVRAIAIPRLLPNAAPKLLLEGCSGRVCPCDCFAAAGLAAGSGLVYTPVRNQRMQTAPFDFLFYNA